MPRLAVEDLQSALLHLDRASGHMQEQEGPLASPALSNLPSGTNPGMITPRIRTSSSYSSPIVIFASVLPCSRKYVTIARVSTPVMAGYIQSQQIFPLELMNVSGDQLGRGATYDTLSSTPLGQTLHRGPV